MIQPSIKEIIFKHPKIKNIFGDSFIYEPANIEEEKIGSLYILAEISSASRSSDDVIHNLASVIRKEFYSNTKKTSEAALETALKKANLFIKNFYKEQKNESEKTDLKNLNLFVAAFNNGSLYFSRIGKIQTVLFRYQEIVQDIDQSLEQNFTKNKLPAFGGIIRGEIEIGDHLIFSNQNLLRLFSLGQLKTMFKTAADPKLASTIESKIKQNKEPFSVFAIFMEIAGESFGGKNYRSYETGKTEPLSLEEIIGHEYVAKTNQSFLEQQEDEKSSLPPGFKNSEKRKTNWRALSFLKLPMISQILLIFFVIFALFVSGGAYLSYQKKQTETQKNEYQKIISDAKEKQNQAQNALVYKDNEGAKIKLEETLKTLKETDFIYLKDEANAITAEIQALLEKINGLIELKNIKVEFDFKDVGLTFKPARIFGYGKNLIFLDSISKDIYKYSMDADTTSGLILTPAENDERFLIGDWTKDTLFFYSSKNKIYFYNPSANSFLNYTIKLTKENANIGDLGFYKDAAYLIDKQNEEIIKYTPVNSENGTVLFSNQKDKIGSPVSVSVAGSGLYLLNTDKQIKQYKNGVWNNINLPNSIKLSKPIKIRLGFKQSNIYILDQEEKKIVAFNSKGEIKQYFSDTFSQPSDFWLTDDEKIIYLLDGQKTYKIDLK